MGFCVLILLFVSKGRKRDWGHLSLVLKQRPSGGLGRCSRFYTKDLDLQAKAVMLSRMQGPSPRPTNGRSMSRCADCSESSISYKTEQF